MEASKSLVVQEGSDLSKLDSLATEIEMFCKPIKDIVVADDPSCEIATTNNLGLKKLIKNLEEKRKEMTKPLDDRKKEIMDYEKRLLVPLTSAANHLQLQLRGYQQVLEAKKEEARKQAEAEKKRLEDEAKAKIEAERAELETIAMFGTSEDVAQKQAELNVAEERTKLEIEQKHRAATASISSMGVRGATKRWTFKVTDPNKVPAQFMMVNEQAVRLAVNSGVRVIEGVEIYQETSVSAR